MACRERDVARLTASGMSGRDADGLKLMRDAGAALAAQPGTMMFYGPILPGTSYGSQIQAATSMQPQLWVNQDAQRFVNENMFLQNFAYAGNAVYNQKRAFNICNQALLDRYAAEGPDVGVGVYVNIGDPQTEVLDANDAVIPGLYAGGSDAGGLYGDTYDVGIAAGSQASWAINSGRLAAKNAARYLGYEVEE